MDPISDMFIRIKNAQKAGHETVQIPYAKFKYEIAMVLERSGFVGKVEKKGKRIKKTMEMELLYQNETPIINGVKIISKPSRRLYISCKDIKQSRHGGIIILSTPQGVMTNTEARKAKVGGQLIAEVW